MRCAVLVSHDAFRQAMAHLLASDDPRIEPVERASSTVEEARSLVMEHPETINVVVSELSLSDREAANFLTDLGEAKADVPVLVLTHPGDHDSRVRAQELGAARVMGMEACIGEIFATIRQLGGLEDT